MRIVRVIFELEVEDSEFSNLTSSICGNKQPKQPRKQKHPHVGPRKERKDIGKARTEGDMSTRFYTPEICELINCKHRSVNGKIKTFNRMGIGEIKMPGRPCGDGYTASEDTWEKFFKIFCK